MPDLSASGSITLELSCDGQSVSGGQIAVYMVGSVVQDDGDLGFSLSDDFSGCGLSLEIDYDSASEVKTLAAELAAYADENDISGITAEAGSDGKITVSGISVGLYLIIQTQSAEGYEAFAPFLVSVPMYDETKETYVYDVDASPKVTLTKIQEETTAASEEQTSSDDSEEESTTSGEDNEEESTSTGDGKEESTASASDSKGESTASGTEESTAEETTASEDTGSNVQTEDDAHLMMWFVIFWASALILVILVIRKNQVRKK